METTQIPEQKHVMKDLINHLYDAFDFFNKELFNSLLPTCNIAIGVKKGAHGVYRADRFLPKDLEKAEKNDTPKMDEILLNPTSFDRDEIYVLSTLVHEMVHQIEQHQYDNTAKGGYHNKQWAESMKAVGLFPSSTGEPGGKQTGRKVSHYIIEGGKFEDAVTRFISGTNFTIEWVVLPKLTVASTPRKRTYRCGCPQPWYSNLSGRKGTCGECNEDFIEDEV